MSTLPVPHTVPTLEAVPSEPIHQPPASAPEVDFFKQFFALVGYLIGFVFGWAWRIMVAGLLGLNFGTSILIVGFLNRWTQGQVLYGLWKSRGLYEKGSFTDFCARLGPDAPVLRPRWFLRDWFRKDHIQQELTERTVDNEPPGPFRLAHRAVILPFRSLWLNVKLGFLGVFCTYVLTAWGCLLMQMGWEFGWLNSFNKGYEQAPVGAITSLVGIAVFLLAMVYVPMAQIHQAVTGDFRAFFDFRFVWQLIRARYLSYVVLSAGIVAFGVGIQLLKVVPMFLDDHSDAWSNASDEAVANALSMYFFWCNVTLFLGLLLTRWLASLIYRSALLKVLRRGRVTQAHLHPTLSKWFDAVGGLPPVNPERKGVWLYTASTAHGLSRYAAYFALLYFIWLPFVATIYVSEFFCCHPYIGFLNQPQIQLPAFDYVPSGLTHRANGWDSLPTRLTPKEDETTVDKP